jgi:hypothetical protein
MFNFSILYVLKQSKLDVGFRHLQLLLFHEPMAGIEPATSSLPRKCSTPELHRQNELVMGLSGVNPMFALVLKFSFLERKTGLKPATLSLEG